MHDNLFMVQFRKPYLNDAEKQRYEDEALNKLEKHLGYRFDEDSWFSFTWTDRRNVDIGYTIPYEARRLPL